jgi:hypothetical protein
LFVGKDMLQGRWSRGRRTACDMLTECRGAGLCTLNISYSDGQHVYQHFEENLIFIFGAEYGDRRSIRNFGNHLQEQKLPYSRRWDFSYFRRRENFDSRHKIWDHSAVELRDPHNCEDDDYDP